MAARVELNMDGLIEVANEVNTAVCRPLAEKVAASGPGLEVNEVWPRTSVEGWARTRVHTETFAAMRREVRDGTMAKALGRL